MSERFYLAEPPTGDTLELDGPEAHHIAQVMRAAVGDELTLFDGRGQEYTARIERIARRSLTLRILQTRAVDRELGVELIVGVALPRGERQAWLVEKLVELGATAIVPLRTQHGVAQPSSQTVEKINRWIIEATKQCGRTRLMQVQEPVDWGTFVAQWEDAPTRRIMLHPHDVAVQLGDLDARAARRIVVAVGPEGGFHVDELHAARARGWTLATLGTRILRVETAAIAAAVWAGLQRPSET